MSVVTLMRKMDNGYGKVIYIQENEIQLNMIHQYFEVSLKFIDHRFDLTKPFENIESIIQFLDDNWDKIVEGEIKTGLTENEEFDDFIESCNPNGYGNEIDNLVILYEDKILYDRKG
jgi:hypothetical protein